MKTFCVNLKKNPTSIEVNLDGSKIKTYAINAWLQSADLWQLKKL